MINNIIPKSITNKVLMIGNYYKGAAPGGMAAVIRVYNDYYETLKYISSWRDVSKIGKVYYAISAYLRTFILLTINRNIKIVHIHSTSNASFYRKARFVRIAKMFKKKVILHMHSAIFMDFYNNSKNKEYIKKTLLMSDRLVVLSVSWKEYFNQLCVPEEKITIINNPVATPKQLEIKKEKTVRMLFLGELRERKGVWDILKALNKHQNEIKSNIEFRIGGNKGEAEIKQYIVDNGLSDFVKIEGWVSGRKKWELLNWANLMILPSFAEGLPITLLEAMSYSCALISTPVGGIPEILENGTNGIMVTPGNTNEIAQAILYYINNPQKLIEHGIQSHQKVEPYLPSTVFKQLTDLYTELLEK